MSKLAPPKYKTTNWKTYNAALKARGSLMIWLDHDMRWHGSAVGQRGRTPTFSDAAIQFCLTIKCLFNLALRQAVGMVQSLLKLAGLDWLTPDYSTVCRRQKHLQVAIPCRPTTTGLHLLIDSTGIKMLGEGEWKTKKHGAEYRRQWRKVHLGIDAQTLEIRAIEVTDNAVGDAPMLPELLDQIPAGERIAAVSGDGAYDTKGCHEAIAKRKAEAVIPTRKNAKPWKENRLGAHVRNEILRATRRLGRAIWRKWSGYHRRSLVETKMRCFKLLGERVMARGFDRQVADLQVRAAILNRFTRLGTPMTVRMP
ncbi:MULTISPECIES: IS5 family transposase [Chromobacterium]|uniref:IS5 family transposase n=1 Tax=Chromobacterium rhizoryzae TaxID=1778675 RepID=A0AAD0RQC6_9NEIS|nr:MULTISPECIES: IS5 family transposase [Chromobacterium]AXT45495.1 IS5 family transposase [Chromobacterium rhizoryzae]QOD83770.1 IS5 family transposase [Chromobacterium haemolyticum]